MGSAGGRGADCVFLLILLILLIDILPAIIAGPAVYQWKHYTYRKKRDDKKYRNARQRCEMSLECQNLYGVENTKCVRMCISETCYNELYGDDPLEEGEIDVRLNSFKGCLSQVTMADL